MLKELSKTLSHFYVMHTYKEDKNRLYFTLEGFTAYLTQLDTGIIYLRVYRAFDESDPTQTEQDKKVCRAKKYLILKKLWALNARVNNQYLIEPLPRQIDETLLFPNEKLFKPIPITEFE
jgi:hypothetical protein